MITGVSTGGRADTPTVAGSVAPPGVLSANTGRIPDISTASPTAMTYLLTLGAEYRDDAASPNGLCMHQVVPATWRVRLPGGFAVTVPNADAGSPTRLDSSGGLVTCRGRLGTVTGRAFFG